jgi:hypothetical protein
MCSRNVISILAAVVFLAVPLRAVNASGPDGFIRWALEQGERFDHTWSRITAERTQGAVTGSGTTAAAGSGTVMTPWIESTVAGGSSALRRSAGLSAPGTPAYQWRPASDGTNWTRTNANFIHKGEPQLLPMSTRERASPSRGVSRLSSPANAHLGVSYDRLRVPNARVPQKHFFQDRAGKWRLSPRTGSRLSSSAVRGRGSSRPALRPDRPKRSR